MITIGKASEISGVNIETIRYYEREGIVERPGRTASGRRVYSKAEVTSLRFVKRCRDLGFSLADIKVLLRLGGEGNGNCAEVKQVSEGQMSLVRSKIAALQKLESALKELTGNCRHDDDYCQILTVLMGDDWA